MEAEQVTQVLEHIDLERWGYRKAELVRLVAILQEGPNPVPLGRQMLMAMGRTHRQARYDHELLVRLSEDRVLIRWRGQGRQPDSWAVGPVEGWRQIRWITPRREVIRAFSSPLPGAAVALWTKTAGQPCRSGPIDPENGWSTTTDPRSNHWSTTQQPLDPTQRATLESPVDMVHNATAPSAASPSSFDSEFTPSLPPSQAGTGRGSEGGSADQGQDPGEVLLAAVVANHGGEWIGGEYADRIRRVGRARPALLPQLLAYAGKLQWVKRASEAARQMELQLAALDQTPDARRSRAQSEIEACPRCDHKGLIWLPDDTVTRCDHVPHDEDQDVGLGLSDRSQVAVSGDA